MQTTELKSIIAKYKQLADAAQNQVTSDQDDFLEEEIYQMITNSAKTNFDYGAFMDYFSTFDKKNKAFMADKMLWLVIKNLAAGDSPQMVASKIQNELLLTGFVMPDIGVFEKIITDNIANWREEIGVLQIITDMIRVNFAPVDQIYLFVSELFEIDYEPERIVIPWLLRKSLDKFMDEFKDELNSYELFFTPYDEPSPQGWDELHLKCEKQNDDWSKQGTIILTVIFKHSEREILIPTLLVNGVYQFTEIRMNIISLLLKLCLSSGYQLFFVQLGEAFHEKLIKRGATYIDFETVEITEDTNLEATFKDE